MSNTKDPVTSKDLAEIVKLSTRLRGSTLDGLVEDVTTDPARREMFLLGIETFRWLLQTESGIVGAEVSGPLLETLQELEDCVLQSVEDLVEDSEQWVEQVEWVFESAGVSTKATQCQCPKCRRERGEEKDSSITVQTVSLSQVARITTGQATPQDLEDVHPAVITALMRGKVAKA